MHAHGVRSARIPSHRFLIHPASTPSNDEAPRPPTYPSFIVKRIPIDGSGGVLLKHQCYT
jgi:hypothetical protein